MIYIDFFITIFPLILLTKYESILLKLILIIAWYPLLILLLFKNEVPLTGVISLEKENLDGKIAEYGFYSYLLGLYAFNAVLYGVRKKDFSSKEMRFKRSFRTIILVGLFFSMIFVMNTHSGDEGSAKTATFFLFFNSLLLVSFKTRDYIWLLQTLCLFFLIINGERVDSIILVFLVFMIVNKKGVLTFGYNKRYLYLGGFTFFILLVAVGFLREDGGAISPELIFAAFYSQLTVCDVVYVFLTGIKYVETNGIDPSVLLNLFGGLIPGETMGVSSPFYYGNYLQKFMRNPGGGLFCTEGYLAFGFIGPFLYFCIYGLLLRKLFVSSYRFKKYIFLLFMVLQCRLIWYGLIYIYKPLLILYIGLHIMRRFELKNKIRKLTTIITND